MKKNANFIIVSDDDTKQRLIKAGYSIVAENGANTTFLNCNKLNFDDSNKVVFTNKLCV